MNQFLAFSVVLGLFFSLQSTAQTANLEWKVLKPAWTTTDEDGYSDFIYKLGTSGCKNVDACLKNPANPFRNSDPANLKWTADCGRFSSLLRAYYAWKNGLPFSFVNDVKAVGSSNDLRYSSEGNIPTGRRDILGATNGPAAIKAMLSEINTAMYRYHPQTDVKADLFPDYYPVKINRQSIRPGTMIYDPNGHVAVIYKVEEDGRILFFDAHPDYTVSHGVYGEKFVRSRPGMGAGFKNWRPFKVENGKVIGAANKQIMDYSTEQFFGNKPSADGKWQNGKFILPTTNEVVDYYDFVRTKMALGDLKYEPIEEMTNMMDALCQDIQDRNFAIDVALQHGIQNAPHPSNLPNNIYGTDGDWESYSTPSRDARLKSSFLELRKNVEKFVTLYKNNDPRINYQGTDLAGDLKIAYAESAKKCTVTYTKSNQAQTTLGYEDIVERLFKLSFDPYHCAELRWGAVGTELSSCKDDQTKRAWYNAEQNLRNQLDRRYDVKMGFSLEQLMQGVAGSGIGQAPDVDLKTYLERI